MTPAHTARLQAAAYLKRVIGDIHRNLAQEQDQDKKEIWQELLGDVEEAVSLLEAPPAPPEPAEAPEEEE